MPSPAGQHNSHLEMSDFMLSKKTVVFRRFYEVHVRLLLHLQDEISTLEKELLELENADSGRPDMIVNKANVMRELRKALAEYGE